MSKFFKNIRFPFFFHARNRAEPTLHSGQLTVEELRRLVADMVD